MRKLLMAAAACVVVGTASPSPAGEVKLVIRNGLVTLQAKDATLREILAEWSRVGRTRMVNAEGVPGGPMSVQFTGLPERQALETLLRSIAGFVAVARVGSLDAESTYDRIVLLPVARPAVVAARAGGPAGGPAGGQPTRDRVVIPPPMVVPDDDEDQVAPVPGQGRFGGAGQPGMPTQARPYGPAGTQDPNAPQMNPAPQLPPAVQAAPRPGMVTAPVNPPAQTVVIK